MIKLIRKYFFIIAALCLYCSSSAQDASDLKIGVVHSESTKQLLYKKNENFYPILNWELFLMNSRINYSVVSDNDLSDFSFSELDILIMPSVEILSDPAIENLKEFLDQGKNLFVLGGLGSFDPRLNIRNPEALEILTGKDVIELPREEISRNISFYSSNFLTQDINADTKYLVLNTLSTKYIKLMPDEAQVLGSYLSYDVNGNLGSLTAAAALETRKGKILWFGFQLAQISLNEKNRTIFHQIILNGIDWLADRSSVWVNPFPDFCRSATLFSIWTNDINNTFNEIVPLFKLNNIPLNFFVSSSEIRRSSQEVYRLSSAGHLNLLFDAFSHLNADTSKIKLIFKEASEIMRSGSRQEYFGIQTKNLLESNRYKKKLKDYFDFLLYEGSNFAYLNNDFIFKALEKVSYYYINDPVKTIENDEEEYFRYIYDELNKSGGVVSFIITDYSGITSDSLIQKKVNQIINDYNMRGSFLTTYSDLIDWTQAMSSIEVDLSDHKDESMLTLKAKNTSRRITERIGLIICVPSHYKPYSTSSTNINIDYNSETGYYNILIPFIHPNQTLIFNIHYLR